MGEHDTNTVLSLTRFEHTDMIIKFCIILKLIC